MTPPGNEATPGVSVAVRTRLGLTRSDSLTWALHTLLVAVLDFFVRLMNIYVKVKKNYQLKN